MEAEVFMGCDEWVVTGDIYTTRPPSELKFYPQLMAEHEVTHLVVVDSETSNPVGVISTLDVAKAVSGTPGLAPAV